MDNNPYTQTTQALKEAALKQRASTASTASALSGEPKAVPKTPEPKTAEPKAVPKTPEPKTAEAKPKAAPTETDLGSLSKVGLTDLNIGSELIK